MDCYSCEHMSVCGTRFEMWNLLMKAGHLEPDKIEFNVFFEKLAAACQYFKERKK